MIERYRTRLDENRTQDRLTRSEMSEVCFGVCKLVLVTLSFDPELRRNTFLRPAVSDVVILYNSSERSEMSVCKRM